MTTVLVFLPLLFVKEEAGQLFSDIGIAISASIIVSMLVAVTLVPVAYANLPRWAAKTPRTETAAAALLGSAVLAPRKAVAAPRLPLRHAARHHFGLRLSH
jgi:multidrug efflux pump subunit AcrB